MLPPNTFMKLKIWVFDVDFEFDPKHLSSTFDFVVCFFLCIRVFMLWYFFSRVGFKFFFSLLEQAEQCLQLECALANGLIKNHDKIKQINHARKKT